MSYANRVTSFVEVGDIFGKIADALEVLMHGFGLPWAPGSPAEAESAYDEEFAGEWTDKPLSACVLLAGPLLGHTEDHMRAMAKLTGDPQVLMAPLTLVRSVLGSAARVRYLLEPDIGPKERIRRGMSLRLKSLDELSRLVPEASDQFAGATQRIVRSARASDIRVTERKRRADGSIPAPNLGPPLPSDMEFVRLMLSEVGAETGDSIYRLTSTFVHGETHITSLLSRVAGANPGPASGTFSLGLRLDNFVIFSASTVLAVHHTALAVLTYAGLPESVWQDLAQPLLNTWRES